MADQGTSDGHTPQQQGRPWVGPGGRLCGEGEGEGGDHFSVNAIISLVNVLFFIVVQTIFFWLVASREVDRVVRHKAEILRIIRRRLLQNRLDGPALALDRAVLAQGARVHVQAEEQRLRRRAANLRRTLLWMGPIAGGVIVAIAALIALNRSCRHTFGLAQRFGLFLVLFVYVFEVLFFVLVVDRYTMIGDVDLVRQVTGLEDIQ